MAAEFSVATFKSEVLGSEKPVMVDFWSHGCPPCKRLAPVIDELANDNEGNAKIGKVNVGDNMDLAVEYGISAVPTILVFKGGEVVERMQGFQDKSKLQEILDAHATSA
jgi:thioredoxin 1